MSLRIVIAPLARSDITFAVDWYNQKSSPIAEDFKVNLDRTMYRISEHPERYRVVHRDMRRALLSKFPFGVFFRVLPEIIQVVGVLHTSQDPALWRRRSR